MEDQAIERFWAKVDTSSAACWLWKGSLGSHGYGQFQCGKRSANGHRIPELAHRVSWFLEHGEWPQLWVLHRCDNRQCVRPSHLYLGDHSTNMADMVAKGRWSLDGTRKTPSGDDHYLRLRPENIRKGEQIGNSKLTPAQVQSLRKDRLTGLTFQELGDRYGVSKSEAFRIVKGRVWKHVQGTR